MEKTTENMEKLAALIEKYKKNKTLVSPEDLAGKYKASFEKLKTELKEALQTYLAEYIVRGLELVSDESLEEFENEVNRIVKDTRIGKSVGIAAFKEFDLEKIQKLAEELRTQVYKEAWVPYFHKHTCLYAQQECFMANNPQIPRIYNSLVDKFWDEGSSKWVKDAEAKKTAVLIYIQKGKTA